MEKKFLPSERRIAFCRLFIVQVKKVCYERKVLGELLDVFYTVHRSASTHIFPIQALD